MYQKTATVNRKTTSNFCMDTKIILIPQHQTPTPKKSVKNYFFFQNMLH